MRTCSTPGKDGKDTPSADALQPVAWLLSRSIRIWKVFVVADAADAKAAMQNSTAKAILAATGFK